MSNLLEAEPGSEGRSGELPGSTSQPRATPGVATGESPRRTLSPRQSETVDRLVDAAVVELRAVGFDDLTIRNVARRASVAPATAYNYFSSREHLVTELFWRRLVDTPQHRVDRRRSAVNRVSATLVDLAMVVSDEPELSAACTQAMLGADPEVALLRERIGLEMHRRLLDALGEPDAPRTERDATVLRSLEIAISGSLLQTGMGYLSYDELPDRLTEMAGLLMGGDS